jgi:hypothetical protein
MLARWRHVHHLEIYAPIPELIFTSYRLAIHYFDFAPQSHPRHPRSITTLLHRAVRLCFLTRKLLRALLPAPGIFYFHISISFVQMVPITGGEPHSLPPKRAMQEFFAIYSRTSTQSAKSSAVTCP